MPKILSSLHAFVFTAAVDFLEWPTALVWGFMGPLILLGPKGARNGGVLWVFFFFNAFLVAFL